MYLVLVQTTVGTEVVLLLMAKQLNAFDEVIFKVNRTEVFVLGVSFILLLLL